MTNIEGGNLTMRHYIVARPKPGAPFEITIEEVPLYGVWNDVQKRFVFGIKETSPRGAEKALFRRIGKDAYRWRYSIKQIPRNWRNPSNPNWPRK
jgi:hypothetical protein